MRNVLPAWYPPKLMHQSNGGPARDAQQFFEPGAIDERAREGAQLLQSGSQPIETTGAGKAFSSQGHYSTLWHSCANDPLF